MPTRHVIHVHIVCPSPILIVLFPDEPLFITHYGEKADSELFIYSSFYK